MAHIPLHACPIFYCVIGAFHGEPVHLFVLWWCCLLCLWHQGVWNPVLEGCVVERQRVNASHWLKVQFVTRVCCRATTWGVLSLKGAECQAAVPGVSIKACVCSIPMDVVRLGGCVCVQHLCLWCWTCICILFKAALGHFVLPAKSRGGGVSTSECSSLSVENKPLEGFGMVKTFCLYSEPGIVLTAKEASNSSFYGQHFLV